MRVVLHIHTNFSACSESRVEAIAEYCRKHDIETIGLTDHNTIEGALRLRSIAPELCVIVGEEITTAAGEVIGLFLTETVAPRQELRQTCLEIKRQGGLVYVPHPFDIFKVHRLRRRPLHGIIDVVDIIEVFNAKSNLSWHNRRAFAMAKQYGKVGAAGSDSHYLTSLDHAINVMDPFDGPADFLEKLSRAAFITTSGGVLATWWVRVRQLLHPSPRHR